MNEDALTAELMKSVEADPEVATPVEPTEEEAPAAQAEPVKEEEQQTVEDLFKEQEEEDDTVPLAAHIETKKQLKDLKKTVKDLQDQIANSGKSGSKEVAGNISALTEKYPDLDPDFIQDIANTLKVELKKETEDDLRPFREEAKQERIQKTFDTHFAKALELAPEYRDVANADVIKTLSLQPQNAKKTFVQIIEETYGKSIVGRKPMDSVTPRGGHELESVDLERAAVDEKYLEQVLSNPKTKEEYNQKLQSHYRL